eukprot:353783-Chlamydomonas_euryale.AAC.1
MLVDAACTPCLHYSLHLARRQVAKLAKQHKPMIEPAHNSGRHTTHTLTQLHPDCRGVVYIPTVYTPTVYIPTVAAKYQLWHGQRNDGGGGGGGGGYGPCARPGQGHIQHLLTILGRQVGGLLQPK